MVVADRTDDGEGMLLEKIRAIAPKTPLAVSLDLHGNVTAAMVRMSVLSRRVWNATSRLR